MAARLDPEDLEEIDEADAIALWARRHRALVDRWLARHPPPASWTHDADAWAWLEMPDPRRVIGRWLIRIGW